MIPASERTRRGVLAAVGTAGAVGLAGCLGSAGGDTQPDSLAVGVLQPLSGPLAPYGRQGLSGFLAGLAYKTGTEPTALSTGEYVYSSPGASGDSGTDNSSGQSDAAGPDDAATEIVLRVRDTESAARTAVNRAETLVNGADIDALYGVAGAPGAAQVSQIAADGLEIPFILCPTTAAALTSDSDRRSPRLFRTTAHTGMTARGMATHLTRTQAQSDQVALVTTDNSFGRVVRDQYAAVFGEATPEIVSERRVAADADAEAVDWAGVLATAADAGADVLVAGVTDVGVAKLAAAVLHERPSLRLQGSFNGTTALTDELTAATSDLNAALQAAPLGPFVSRYHWNQYDNAINDAFVRLHREAYDTLPNLFTAGGFTAASALVQAVDTGARTPDGLTEALSGMTVTETPKGHNAYAFRDRDNQARSPVTVAPLATGNGSARPTLVGPGEPVARIAGGRLFPDTG